MIECKNKVAILMATYNGEKFIADQIDSILKQSFDNWSLYIHDDDSSDNTVNIIKSYVKKYPKKIFIISGPRTGSAKNNFFYLMKKVSADYIMFSDQDDYWLSNKIKNTFEKLLKLQNGELDKPVVVFTDLKVVNEKLKVISNKMSSYQSLTMSHISFNNLMIENVVTGCTMMINRSCRNLSLKSNNYDNIIMHDWWCALVASYFGKIDYIDQSLILYRQHSNNTIGSKKIPSLNYFKSIIFNIKKLRKSFINKQNQIKYFIKVYNITTPCLIEYSNLNSKNKFCRIFFLLKNHIYQCGFLRNLALIIFC